MRDILFVIGIGVLIGFPFLLAMIIAEARTIQVQPGEDPAVVTVLESTGFTVIYRTHTQAAICLRRMEIGLTCDEPNHPPQSEEDAAAIRAWCVEYLAEDPNSGE